MALGVPQGPPAAGGLELSSLRSFAAAGRNGLGDARARSVSPVVRFPRSPFAQPMCPQSQVRLERVGFGRQSLGIRVGASYRAGFVSPTHRVRTVNGDA